MGGLTRLLSDIRGAISVLGAFVLIGVIGVSALALEYGHALFERVANQQVADLAAYGGALVYGSTNSTSSATSAASNIASLNGVSSGVSPSVVTSPTGDGNSAVEVTVTTNVPLLLTRVLTTNTTLPVTATSYAEVKTSAPGCIIALSGSGTGVTMNGGTNVNAPNCAVASGNSVTLSGGAALVTQNVDYAKTAPSVSGGASITAPAGDTLHTNKVTTTDPLAASSGSPGSTEVTNVTARISTVASITSPSAPIVTVPAGSAVSFTKAGVAGLPAACTDVLAGTVYTVTCTGTANFGTITLNKVTVVISTSSGNTYNFSSGWPLPNGVTLSGSGGGTYGFGAGVTNSGSTFPGKTTTGGIFPSGTYNVVGPISASGTTTFGPGTYNVTGDNVTGVIVTGGGSTTTFDGSSTFNLGTTTASCGKKGPAGVSICNAGTTMTFDGPDTFVLAGGIYNSGGASLALGSGSSANSYSIGKDGDGASIEAGTSTILTLGDATGAGDIFQAAGSITNGGGNCMTIPATGEHDINGSLDGAGGIVLGAGIYTINGYVALGNGGGGDVSNCPTAGTTTGLNALGVTLVISGTSTVTCGGVASSSFCLGAGYATVDLTAPSSGTTANLAVIGPQSSSNTSVAAFTTGASNTRVSGAFYFPNGAVTMSGAAALQDTVDAGACLELIGSQVTLGGGSAAASSCTGLGGAGTLGTTVTLVQ